MHMHVAVKEIQLISMKEKNGFFIDKTALFSMTKFTGRKPYTSDEVKGYILCFSIIGIFLIKPFFTH